MTSYCHTRTPDEYSDALVAEVDRLADAVAALDPAARVPTCPDWSVADLAEHIGGVHRWAATIVSCYSPTRLSRRDIDYQFPSDPAQLPAWLRAGAPMLHDAFAGADPDREVWVWGADRHVRFWPRRMLHETTMHRVDAELAAGMKAQIDPAVAVDAIDEFLDNLPHAEYFAPDVQKLRGNGETLAWHAADTGVSWRIELGPDAYVWSHDTEPQPTASITADAPTLLLITHGRAPISDADTAGAADVIDRWFSNSAL